MTKEQFKQGIISLIIGFLISILTLLFQFFIDWLQNIPAETVGGVVGMIRYQFKTLL